MAKGARDRNLDGVAVGRRLFLGAAPLAGLALTGPAAAASGPPDRQPWPRPVTTPKDLIVETTAGPIRGFLRAGIRTFRGVPYARPPVGAFRFLPPQPPEPWKDVRWTLVQGPSCPQHNYREPDQARLFVRQEIMRDQDEDCLQLNVWTPEINGAKKRPVMVWLHGGAFLNSSAAATETTEGENLARRGDVVVVSVNHRLNVFGYLDLSAFGDAYRDSANAGLLDLVEALKWVRANIARLGGDPDNVTLFGQSGGGAKVATLMVTQPARGLFHKAIIQSSSSKINTPESSSKLAQLFLQKAGVNRANLADLQAMPAETLVALATEISAAPLTGGIEWRPNADGRVILQSPFQDDGPKLSADIPTLIGGTRHEFSMEASKAFTDEEVRAEFTTRYGAAKADALIGFFRRRHPGVTSNEILALVNVVPFRVNHVNNGVKKAGLGGAGCYFYIFAYKTPTIDGQHLAFHGADRTFVFNTTDETSHQTGATAEAAALSNRMADAWVSFARTGDPNHPGLPAWPKFDGTTRPVMIFDKQCAVVNRPFEDEAEAVAKAGPAQGGSGPRPVTGGG